MWQLTIALYAFQFIEDSTAFTQMNLGMRWFKVPWRLQGCPDTSFADKCSVSCSDYFKESDTIDNMLHAPGCTDHSMLAAGIWDFALALVLSCWQWSLFRGKEKDARDKEYTGACDYIFKRVCSGGDGGQKLDNWFKALTRLEGTYFALMFTLSCDFLLGRPTLIRLGYFGFIILLLVWHPLPRKWDPQQHRQAQGESCMANGTSHHPVLFAFIVYTTLMIFAQYIASIPWPDVNDDDFCSFENYWQSTNMFSRWVCPAGLEPLAVEPYTYLSKSWTSYWYFFLLMRVYTMHKDPQEECKHPTLVQVPMYISPYWKDTIASLVYPDLIEEAIENVELKRRRHDISPHSTNHATGDSSHNVNSIISCSQLCIQSFQKGWGVGGTHLYVRSRIDKWLSVRFTSWKQDHGDDVPVTGADCELMRWARDIVESFLSQCADNSDKQKQDENRENREEAIQELKKQIQVEIDNKIRMERMEQTLEVGANSEDGEAEAESSEVSKCAEKDKPTMCELEIAD